MTDTTRRKLFKSVTAFSLCGISLPAFARTPKATEGPFYPTPSMRFKDADNDLVKVAGAVREAGGEIITLKGRVLTRDGKPADGARVEIWQCDMNGIYLHTADRTSRYDTAFQGFGHVVTGSDGAYAFRTIKPVLYTGRTPHIHVKVFYQNVELTTQFYIAGDSRNDRDRIYRRLSKAAREKVGMRFENGSTGLETTVDIEL